MVKEEDIYYVGVTDPVELRRSILENSKSIIGFLKKYEDLKALRSKKTVMMIQLKDEVDDIRKLVARVKRDLPKSKLRQAEAMAKVKKPVAAKFDLDDLEDELGDIENKLNRLR